ncbi:Glycosyl transferase, group 1 family protein [Lunatimonas lonarensis]|uniref:Glycosyl transferase, group 1 family protein n=1 Tax=Lunatimonas lonarensis TaxID=1232681 RepID=R7ZNH3_9BACT|nr:glycosyltransferase [Lunatimonas lonarensis]EON75603.1 Glycosyl transferase, group 1 family protein [Lunatimonas lonarensis]
MGEIGIEEGGRKVVHLQFGSSPSGNYTIRLHEAFLAYGYDSYVLSLYSEVVGDPRIVSLGAFGKNVRRLNQKIQDYLTRNKPKESGAFSLSLLGSDISNHPVVRQSDVIYVHWVLGGFLSVRNLKQLASLGKPMVMILHDMWTITGGCSYSFDCDKFLTHCGNCPVFPEDKEVDTSYKQYEEKMEFYRSFRNLFFVSPSHWLADLAKRAEITKGKPVYRIPNPIDQNLFKPFDKSVAKGILGLAAYDYVICFGANKVHSPYKGWTYLKDAVVKLKSELPNKEIVMLVFGSAASEEISEAIPFPIKFMGFIRDDYTTNLVYNASDVFLAPSLADNLPTTIIESLCCGTPVVGFETGGIPEMISHKSNGYIAAYRDADDFCKGIVYCLERKLVGKLLPEYQVDVIMDQHASLISYMEQEVYDNGQS